MAKVYLGGNDGFEEETDSEKTGYIYDDGEAIWMEDGVFLRRLFLENDATRLTNNLWSRRK